MKGRETEIRRHGDTETRRPKLSHHIIACHRQRILLPPRHQFPASPNLHVRHFILPNVSVKTSSRIKELSIALLQRLSRELTKPFSKSVPAEGHSQRIC